jgi:hypothetical protein
MPYLFSGIGQKYQSSIFGDVTSTTFGNIGFKQLLGYYITQEEKTKL